MTASHNDSQTSWASIGHLLHFTNPDILDGDVIGRVSYTAYNNFQRLLNGLREHSEVLDGHGATRIAEEISTYKADRKLKVGRTEDVSYCVRPCNINEAYSFLAARNSPLVRVRSTLSHAISPTSHLEWWLKDDVEKFSYDVGGSPSVYLWHREVAGPNGERYLWGGWFPASHQPSFNSVVLVMRWQLDYCSERYPYSTWIAAIHKNNKVVIELNRRFRFKRVPESRLATISTLFNIDLYSFVLMERPAKQ